MMKCQIGSNLWICVIDISPPLTRTELRLLIDQWFGPYMQAWLDSVDAKTSGWVQSAIKADKVKILFLSSHPSFIVCLVSFLYIHVADVT